jgi:hypothetical protein
MAIPNGLTLFTSDSRTRYASDILAVLALPDGFRFHFRYDSRHICTDLRQEFESPSLRGTRALIAFKDEQGASSGNPYIVPVRWATIDSVELLPDFYVINFTLEGYPAYVKEFSGTKDALVEHCRKYLDELPNGTRSLPVQRGLTPFVDRQTRTDKSSWIDVAKRLAMHQTFSATHFLRIGSITNDTGSPLPRNEDGDLSLAERDYARLQIDYFAVNYPENPCELQITSDSSLVRIASRTAIPLDARYDSTKVLIHGGSVPGPTLTGIYISTKDSRPESPQTSLHIPLMIVRARRMLFRRLFFTAVGACLVATPGILGTSVDSGLRIAIAFGGAILVAYGSIVGSTIK